MKSKIKIIFLVFLVGLLLFANTPSVAQAFQLINCGSSSPAGNQTPCGIGDLLYTVRLLINFLLSVAWLVSILFIVVSGVRMILAQGNEESLTKAKASLSNAIIGFIIILTSFIILNLVVGFLTGGESGLTNAFDLIKP